MSKSPLREEPRLVANVGAIPMLRDRFGVWLSVAGAAYYKCYAAALSQRGLKPSWITALAIIERQPGITQSELGRFMAVNRASAMALAVEMEDAGLLARAPLSGRNKTALALTEHGAAMLAEGCAIDDDLSNTVLENMDEEGRRAIVASLQQIDKALQDHASGAGTGS